MTLLNQPVTELVESITVPDTVLELLHLAAVDDEGLEVTARMYGRQPRWLFPARLQSRDQIRFFRPGFKLGESSSGSFMWSGEQLAIWEGITYDVPMLGIKAKRVPFWDGIIRVRPIDCVSVDLCINWH